jgi:hypothetical protein
MPHLQGIQRDAVLLFPSCLACFQHTVLTQGSSKLSPEPEFWYLTNRATSSSRNDRRSVWLTLDGRHPRQRHREHGSRVPAACRG